MYKWIGGIIAIIVVCFFGLIFMFMSLFGVTIEDEKPSSSGSGDSCIVSGDIDVKKAKKKWEESETEKSPLSNKVEEMVDIAEKHKIDPAIFIAIVAHETGYGSSDAVKTHNNPAGLMGSGDMYKFDSIEKGLDYAAKNLYDLYFKEGLNTPEKIGPKYAPVGAKNDPNNLNKNWVPNTKKFVSSITTKNKGSKTESCSNDVDAGGSIKGLEKVLKKHDGKLPKYSGKKFEPNTYFHEQCTWYVYNRRKELGLPVELTFGNGGDWPEKAKAQGYKTGKKAKVGAMVSWPYDSEDFGSTEYGHIAFVEEVHKDGKIKVSEYNIKPLQYGERTFKPKKDLTYIY